MRVVIPCLFALSTIVLLSGCEVKTDLQVVVASQCSFKIPPIESVDIFIDGDIAGNVGPGGRVSKEVSVGTHTVSAQETGGSWSWPTESYDVEEGGFEVTLTC